MIIPKPKIRSAPASRISSCVISRCPAAVVWTCCAGCGKKKRDCEFVFLTCHANFDYAKTALQYGAADYITKPFNIAQTEATLSKVASQVRYHQELFAKKPCRPAVGGSPQPGPGILPARIVHGWNPDDRN